MYVTFDEVMDYKRQINKLKADNARLMSQVSSNRGNNSSTHTIQAEIQEYMSHNPDSSGARLFLIPRDAFNDRGECRNQDFYWNDGID